MHSYPLSDPRVPRLRALLKASSDEELTRWLREDIDRALPLSTSGSKPSLAVESLPELINHWSTVTPQQDMVRKLHQTEKLNTEDLFREVDELLSGPEAEEEEEEEEAEELVVQAPVAAPLTVRPSASSSHFDALLHAIRLVQASYFH